jgi:hypothetical protein
MTESVVKISQTVWCLSTRRFKVDSNLVSVRQGHRHMTLYVLFTAAHARPGFLRY